MIPALLYKDRYDGWQFMMSYTPMEVLTMRQGIRLAKGKVLIGGLGLGFLLRYVAAKPSVKEIVVVEECQEQIDWMGQDIVDHVQAATQTPIELICGNVWDHVGKHGDDTRHLIDIWPGYGGNGWGRFSQARKEVNHIWGWGCIENY